MNCVIKSTNDGYKNGVHIGTAICRVGQNRIYTPYTTVYFVFFLPKIPYIHRIYMVLATLAIW